MKNTETKKSMKKTWVILAVIGFLFAILVYFFPAVSGLTLGRSGERDYGCVSLLPSPDASGRRAGCGSHY